MKTNAAGILYDLFPPVRAEVLRMLFSHRRGERYVRELTRESTFALATVQQELAKLTALGLISSRTDGFHRFYYANGNHPLCHLLREMVFKGTTRYAFANKNKRPRASRKLRRRRDLLAASRMIPGWRPI